MTEADKCPTCKGWCCANHNEKFGPSIHYQHSGTKVHFCPDCEEGLAWTTYTEPAPKPGRTAGARLEWGPKEVEDLRELVANLKGAIKDAPCLVARPGETTYECRVDSLCRVCQWRNTVLADLG